MVVNAKHLQTKVENNASELHEMVDIIRDLVGLIDPVAQLVNAVTKGEEKSHAQPDPSIEVPASAQGEQQSSNASMDALLVHLSNEEPPAKKLRVVLDYLILALTLLNTVSPFTFDNIPFEQFTVNLFSSSSSTFSSIPPPSMTDKEKGISQTFDDDKLKQIMPFLKEGGSAPSLPNIHQFSTT
nr:hypothetical protein [Tanacetum cinerariifolium]